MDHRFGNISGLIAIVIWSLVPVMVTLCAGVPLFPFLSIVCLVTFAIFPISWIVKGEPVLPNLRTPPGALAVTAIGNGLSRGLFWASILMINPAEAFLLNGLWTAIAAVVGVLIAGNAMHGRYLFSLVIVVAAAGALVSGPDGLNAWHVSALASGVIWASYTAVARVDARYSGNAVAGGFLISGLVYLALALATRAAWSFEPVVLGLTLLAGSAGAVGSYIWDIGRRYGDERTLGKAVLLLPLLGTLWLVAFDRSAPEPHIVAGALLVCGAAVAVSPHARRRNIVRIHDMET